MSLKVGRGDWKTGITLLRGKSLGRRGLAWGGTGGGSGFGHVASAMPPRFPRGEVGEAAGATVLETQRDAESRGTGMGVTGELQRI